MVVYGMFMLVDGAFMDKLILGIDPGISGAIAVLDGEHNYIDHLLMPTIKTGKSNRINGAAIVSFLRSYDISHAYLEQVNSMPKQGVASTFNFGHAAGVIEGIIQGMFIPYTLVTPQSWKKKTGLIGTDKAADYLIENMRVEFKNRLASEKRRA